MILLIILNLLQNIDAKNIPLNNHQLELEPNEIIWAGLSGTPPRYFQEGDKEGLGYIEFESRQIRKALENQGIKMRYYYMSPARLEYEFSKKTRPLCFYNMPWSKGEVLFKTPHNAVYSFPLVFSGSEEKKIIIRKGDKQRFEKHLNENGVLKIDSLLADTNLKTILIAGKEYPQISEKVVKKTLLPDGSYDEQVIDTFSKNFELARINTNDQILQMLERKRIDYYFEEFIEYDDYQMTQKGVEGFEYLTLSEAKTISDAYDPSLIYHSIACTRHSMIKKIMPIINNAVKINRESERYIDELKNYRLKLNPLDSTTNYQKSILLHSFTFTKNMSLVDQWYDKQFTNPSEVWKNEMPLENSIVDQDNTLAKTKQEQPHWLLLQKNNLEYDFILLNEVDYIELSLSKNNIHLSKDDLISYKILDKKFNLNEINIKSIKNAKKVIIMARGIKSTDVSNIQRIIQEKTLENLTIHGASMKFMDEIIKFIPPSIKHLYLLSSSLISVNFTHLLTKLNNLITLELDESFIETKQYLDIIKNISPQLENFSINGHDYQFCYHMNPFPNTFFEYFKKRSWTNLKTFSLLNFPLKRWQVGIILDNLPQNIEILRIGSFDELFRKYTMFNSKQVAQFFKKQRPKLRELFLKGMVLDLENKEKIPLPPTLKKLGLTHIPMKDSDLKRLIFHPEIKLDELQLNGNLLTDISVIDLLPFLNSNLTILDLSSNKIKGDFLKNTQFQRIDRLNLHSNLLNDQSIIFFLQNISKIKNINLSNNFLTNKSICNLQANNGIKNSVSELDISNNFISKKGIQCLTFPHLQSLRLNNLASFHMDEFIKIIPKNLKKLEIRANSISDQDIMLLAPYLPKNLNYFDISQSTMGTKGAKALSQNIRPYIDFEFDIFENKKNPGIFHIFSNLSPFLRVLNIENTEEISEENMQILSQKMPRFLETIFMPGFATEKCKFILSHLPSSLTRLWLVADMKSTGSTLKILSESFPEHLSYIQFFKNFQANELDQFYSKIPKSLLFNTLTFYSKLNPLTISKISPFRMVTKYPIYPGAFQIVPKLPQLANLHVTQGALDAISKEQLQEIYFINIENLKSNHLELLRFIKKLPDDLVWIKIDRFTGMDEIIDELVKELPTELYALIINNISLKKESKIKLYNYKIHKEKTTGLPFILIL